MQIPPLQAGNAPVMLRPVESRDTAFLFEVYSSTRKEELARLDWPVAEKEKFLQSQFNAQDHSYRTNYPGAEFFVIVASDTDAGRLYLHGCAGEIRIMDITLLPPFRNRGIGSVLISEILRQAAASNRAATIHVEVFNPALRLYQRLGFQPVARNHVYLLLEWRAP